MLVILDIREWMGKRSGTCLPTILESAYPFSGKRGLRDMFFEADSSRDMFHCTQNDLERELERGERMPKIHTHGMVNMMCTGIPNA